MGIRGSGFQCLGFRGFMVRDLAIQCFGFAVSSLGFRCSWFHGSGFSDSVLRVRGFWFGVSRFGVFEVHGFRVRCSGFGVSRSGFELDVPGSGFHVWVLGSGFRGLGFRVSPFRVSCRSF